MLTYLSNIVSSYEGYSLWVIEYPWKYFYIKCCFSIATGFRGILHNVSTYDKVHEIPFYVML